MNKVGRQVDVPDPNSELRVVGQSRYVEGDGYLQHNPDVAAAGVDPFRHFEAIGWKEGRNPNALFGALRTRAREH